MLTGREFEIGRDALFAAIAGDSESVQNSMRNAVAEDCDIYAMALAWMDTTLAHLTDEQLELACLPPEQSYESGRILSQCEGSDEIKAFDDTDPRIQWCAKLLFARARNDRETASDMWMQQNVDDYPRNVWALLWMCAANIKRAQEQGITPRRLSE
jgi:hypothetical protein